jgi:tetratricopeptide (TPR) repeat protein
VARNEDYRSTLSLWQSNVAVCPQSYRAQVNLGAALLGRDQVDEALERIQLAYELCCRYSKSQADMNWHFAALDSALESVGRGDRLLFLLQQAKWRNPDLAHIRWALGFALLRSGHCARSIVEFRAAIELDPSLTQARGGAATAFLRRGRPADAVQELRRGIEVSPDDINLRDFLSWILATHPDATTRRGSEAVNLSEDVCFVRGSQSCRSWATLAGAYAEVGRFDDAVAAANRAIVFGSRVEGSGSVKTAREQLACYKAKVAYRMDLHSIGPMPASVGE